MPHMEQHELDRYIVNAVPSGDSLVSMALSGNEGTLGNATHLLDVTPSNPLPHPLSLLAPNHCVLVKLKVQRFGC